MKDTKNFLGGESLGAAVENVRDEYSKSEAKAIIKDINTRYGTKYKA